jgi:tRNA/rRNA methyltransferase
VVLVSTRNPLNIGTAARAMSNFGVTRLRVVNPYGPSFREARSAVGASPILESAEAFSSIADAVADCQLVIGTTAAQNRELHHPLRRLDEAAPDLRKELAGGNVALLFGSEKRGLSNADLSHCHCLLHIPTRDGHRSMNLGQAVAVCLYELARDLQTPTVDPTPRAQVSELERLTAVLLESLEAGGYLEPQANSVINEKIRRLVFRLNLSPEDADLLLGMLRKMLWKMTHPPGDHGND